MRQQQLAKQPINYVVNKKQEQCEFEQKPIKNFDEFSMEKSKSLKSEQKNENLKNANKKNLLPLKNLN